MCLYVGGGFKQRQLVAYGQAIPNTVFRWGEIDSKAANFEGSLHM